MRVLLPILMMVAAGPGDSSPPAADEIGAYRDAESKAGKDATAQVRLALWCEAHGMSAERIKHLAAAVAQDPANALARGLLGLVNRGGKWERPEDVSREVKKDHALEALREEYFQRRAKAPDKADDQWKLAQWCDENGLKEESIAHYHAVLRLDPRRESAWKHLGFKKVGSRWVKPEWQAAARREADEQNRANRHWKPILERLRSGLASRDGRRRDSADAELNGVTDPRAVPMVWAVFVTRGASGQELAVRVLGQIDSPGASRALATLALTSKSGAARGQAIQTLRQRDPRDFAPMLVAMIGDPIKYEVKPVQGPGKSGELVIHDGTTKRERIYTPLNEPDVQLGPNDRIVTDPSTGLPVVARLLAVGPAFGSYGFGGFQGMTVVRGALPGAGQISGVLQRAGLPTAQSQKLGQQIGANALASYQVEAGMLNGLAFNTASLGYSVGPAEFLDIPIGQMELDARRSAQVARMQMDGDVRAIESYNAPIRDRNRRVRQILSETAGVDHGDDHSAWMKWVVDLFGYAVSAQKAASQETTVIEQVPLAYQPQAMPTLQFGEALVRMAHGACFGAGTPVRTLDGPRPIETLSVGDLVLTQDSRSGELSYRAVVIAYHNPPNTTYRIGLETGEAIVATGIHRLWKAGKGWTMARDLKPGDVLRTLGGVAAVKTVVPDRVQPVFNLKVAEGESYFVGESTVLAHDNSPIQPVLEPFDDVGPMKVEAPTTPAPVAPRRSMLGH